VNCKERKLPLNPYSGIALILSIIVHGLLVAGFLAASASAPSSAASQRKGEHRMQVRVRLLPAPIVAQPAIPSPATQLDRPQKSAATPPPSKQETVQAVAEIAPQASPAPSAAVATTPAGSNFISPFAPIISQPLGRGSWGSPRPAAPEIDPTQLQRQQAQAELRIMLMDRLGNWLGWQVQQHTEVSCLIRLDLAARQARLSCIPAEKEAEIWSVLNGLLVAGEANGDGMLCMQIGTAGTTQLSIASCVVSP